jgi:hypothetical protein
MSMGKKFDQEALNKAVAAHDAAEKAKNEAAGTPDTDITEQIEPKK